MHTRSCNGPAWGSLFWVSIESAVCLCCNGSLKSIDPSLSKDTTRWSFNLVTVSRNTLWHSLLDRRKLKWCTSLLTLLSSFVSVTLFAAACPIATFLALFNNVVELRGDALKFVWTRRPFLTSSCSHGVGIWLLLLQWMSTLSVMTNLGLIGLHMTELMDYVIPSASSDKWLCIFLLEHTMLAVVFAIDHVRMKCSIFVHVIVNHFVLTFCLPCLCTKDCACHSDLCASRTT